MTDRRQIDGAPAGTPVGCIPQPGPTELDPWCGRCGHLLSDHQRVRETWAAEDEVRTLPTKHLLDEATALEQRAAEVVGAPRATLDAALGVG